MELAVKSNVNANGNYHGYRTIVTWLPCTLVNMVTIYHSYMVTMYHSYHVVTIVTMWLPCGYHSYLANCHHLFDYIMLQSSSHYAASLTLLKTAKLLEKKQK